jgi:ferric-dicitrate binding protein FerR (iron transport regulator)
MRARLKGWSKDSDEKKAERWRWIKAVQEFRAAEAEAEAILREPPKPPYRRWAYGFLAGCVAVGMLVAAWVTSDARSRRQWQS